MMPLVSSTRRLVTMKRHMNHSPARSAKYTSAPTNRRKPAVVGSRLSGSRVSNHRPTASAGTALATGTASTAQCWRGAVTGGFSGGGGDLGGSILPPGRGAGGGGGAGPPPPPAGGG